MTRMAAVDLGSNSIRLLVARRDGIAMEPIFKDLITTRLGEGVGSEGVLSGKAMERALDAVEHFKQKATSMGAQHIVAIATSAVRNANNRDDFIKRIRDLGLDVSVLTGEEEAELGFLGATQGVASANSDVFLVDIGGGSTELIYGKKAKIHRLRSLGLGAVRLTEAFITSDPINREEMDAAKDFVLNSIADETEILPDSASEMVGIGGTITTLAAIAQRMDEYDPNRIHNFIISRQVVQRILKRLVRVNIGQRQNIPGLQAGRADIIVAGTIILDCLMGRYGFERLIVSEWDNLEGIIYKSFLNKTLDG